MEAGDAEGYALCLSPEMTSEVCGPGVPGGERARFGRRKVAEHINLAHKVVVLLWPQDFLLGKTKLLKTTTRIPLL